MLFALYESASLRVCRRCPAGWRARPRMQGARAATRRAPESFPEHGELERKMNTYCHPPREELTPRGAFAGSLAYHQGGWTCAEYSVARKNGTIANAADDDVQAVEIARPWPDDVTAYAKMMDEASEQPVAFTKHGDRERSLQFLQVCVCFW